ncbi:hypothetical protein MMC13_007561 [Lambiella insularis]|nr:hypothetical protein [Lambiella insularis]
MSPTTNAAPAEIEVPKDQGKNYSEILPNPECNFGTLIFLYAFLWLHSHVKLHSNHTFDTLHPPPLQSRTIEMTEPACLGRWPA